MKIKEECPPTTTPVAPPTPVLPSVIHSPVKVKPEEIEIKPEPEEIKMEVEEEEQKSEVITEIKEEILEVSKEEEEEEEEEIEEPPPSPPEMKKEKLEKLKEFKEDEIKSPPPTPISTRRSSHYKSDKEEDKCSDGKEEKSKCKKLSREERKLEAILRAIEQMEKAESRKQEHQAKQAHRRESEPGPNPKEEEKQEPKMKRRRRKGRARTVSQSARRNRLNSTDSYLTSGDENLLSPTDSNQATSRSLKDCITSEQSDSNKAVGLLLALSNGDNTKQHEKSPPRDPDSNSNSAHSSPETQLSSACLLVQAAVEPLEPGFKFPKTKKGLMNEWLNKVPDPVQSASSISPTSLQPHVSNNTDLEATGFYSTPSKNLAALAQVASFCDSSVQPRGNAKKRWLRQAISEDHSCDSPSSRPGKKLYLLNFIFEKKILSVPTV